MTVLPSLVDAAAVALVGAFVWYVTRGQSNQLKELVKQQTVRIDRMEDRFEGRFERLESEIAAVRSDLTQIALAVGARARPQTR